jgi:hypothetical protein
MKESTGIQFTAKPEERVLIDKIVKRANYYGEKGLSLAMDLEAVHSNGTPLDFEKLFGFPDFDFAHDIYGIMNRVDRTTGKLTDCFLPRCAR